jgi:hypothetical protein
MEKFDPIHFSFKEWKECFQQCRQFDKAKKNYQMIISTHWATEGYWVEPKGNLLGESDHLYVGKKIYALEERVKKAVEQAEKNNSSAVGLVL